jgi:TonB family protein
MYYLYIQLIITPMRYYFIVFALILPCLLFAQETKKVVVAHKSTKEEYYVLKGTNVKHGAYTRIFKPNIVHTTGFYNNGLKDSTWINYDLEKPSIISTYKNGKLNGYYAEYFMGKIRASGNYINDTMAGEWSIYGSDDKLEQVYDYTLNKLIRVDTIFELVKGDSAKGSKGFINASTLAAFKGGSWALLKLIRKEVVYPEKEKMNDIAGKVLVKFTINYDGTCSDMHVLKSISPGLDKEAMRVLQLTYGDWYPASINKVATNCDFTIPVVFKIF